MNDKYKIVSILDTPYDSVTTQSWQMLNEMEPDDEIQHAFSVGPRAIFVIKKATKKKNLLLEEHKK
jgi:hypothetical protein